MFPHKLILTWTWFFLFLASFTSIVLGNVTVYSTLFHFQLALQECFVYSFIMLGFIFNHFQGLILFGVNLQVRRLLI